MRPHARTTAVVVALATGLAAVLGSTAAGSVVPGHGSSVTSTGADLRAGAGPSTRHAGPPKPHHTPASHFTQGRVDNEWFPLRPGTQLVYRGRDDSGPFRDVFITTYRTTEIDHVVCREVFDRVFQRGRVRERTSDWYAQTKRGVVWYFGERTALLSPRGRVVSREGSWRSGRNGAEAGVFMPAHPHVGQVFRQEDYPGHAEDRFRVLSLHARVSTPALASHHALLTRETTPLEPGVVDHKKYVRDIGTVTEATVRGGFETDRLVSITHLPRH